MSHVYMSNKKSLINVFLESSRDFDKTDNLSLCIGLLEEEKEEECINRLEEKEEEEKEEEEKEKEEKHKNIFNLIDKLYTIEDKLYLLNNYYGSYKFSSLYKIYIIENISKSDVNFIFNYFMEHYNHVNDNILHYLLLNIKSLDKLEIIKSLSFRCNNDVIKILLQKYEVNITLLKFIVNNCKYRFIKKIILKEYIIFENLDIIRDFIIFLTNTCYDSDIILNYLFRLKNKNIDTVAKKNIKLFKNSSLKMYLTYYTPGHYEIDKYYSVYKESMKRIIHYKIKCDEKYSNKFHFPNQFLAKILSYIDFLCFDENKIYKIICNKDKYFKDKDKDKDKDEVIDNYSWIFKYF